MILMHVLSLSSQDKCGGSCFGAGLPAKLCPFPVFLAFCLLFAKLTRSRETRRLAHMKCMKQDKSSSYGKESGPLGLKGIHVHLE